MKKYLRDCNYQERWELIRETYKGKIDEIMSSGVNGCSPYFLDWESIFTPIEEYAWAAIRGVGFCPMYPQFPVKNYFIDFANPILKVGLECDGKDWHDKEKDRERDMELASDGWEIYRVSGSECYMSLPSPEQIQQRVSEDGVCFDYDFGHDGSDIADWFHNTVDGVVRSISNIYFRPNNGAIFYSYSLSSLEEHCEFRAGEILDRINLKSGKYGLNTKNYEYDFNKRYGGR